MELLEAMRADGLAPPQSITPGRWVRFPGVGKGRSNRAGWCRLISPTLAIYGDWSTGLTATWRDSTHRDDAESARLLAQARLREQRFAAEQRQRQEEAARVAERLIRTAQLAPHPYLERKGFPALKGLVTDDKLLIPVRDCYNYQRIISLQEIDANGEKRFLPGGRARGGIHRLGAPARDARRIVLCEGYATGLSLQAALGRFPGAHTVIVCFSAMNLELVAERFPEAIVGADNDASQTGEIAARGTGLPWIMPPLVSTDWNDVHLRDGLPTVAQALRMAWDRR